MTKDPPRTGLDLSRRGHSGRERNICAIRSLRISFRLQCHRDDEILSALGTSKQRHFWMFCG
ncbi:UNVERIFIED_ORG: hypothetical protein GGI63_000114 [Rhizobium esperanzae]